MAKWRAENQHRVFGYARSYYIRHKELISLRSKGRSEMCRTKRSLHAKEYRLNNYELLRLREKESTKKAILGLKDSYIKNLIIREGKIKRSHIPKCLVEAKRMQILINRTLKEHQKCKT